VNRLRELQDQKVKLAVDLLDFDEPVTKAMWYACGDTVVTETLEQAKQLAYGRDNGLRVKVSSLVLSLSTLLVFWLPMFVLLVVKALRLHRLEQVVSEDGSLISKNGIMTGGDPSIFESKMKRWQSGETDKLKEKYKKNYADLEVRNTAYSSVRFEDILIFLAGIGDNS